jgi:hypothetical protein
VVDLKCHDPHMARAVAAWLCRRHTEATPGELAEWLGLSRADSVPNLTHRFQARLKSQPELLNDVEEILRRATTVVADRRRTTLETPNAKRRLGHSKTKTKSYTAQRRGPGGLSPCHLFLVGFEGDFGIFGRGTIQQGRFPAFQIFLKESFDIGFCDGKGACWINRSFFCTRRDKG